MLLATIDVLKNTLTPDRKMQLIEMLTSGLVEVQGASSLPATWVGIYEFEASDRAIGA